MEFLCHHRDRPGSQPLRDELLEAHWSYMDRYTKEMIARGPTLADDGHTPTGSLHIVDLPDAAAARAFAFDEPNHQAGVYRDVLLRRWHNTLGRTMWEFPGGPTGGNRYLVLGLGTGQATDLAVPPCPDALIAYGPLLSDDGHLAGHRGVAPGTGPRYGTRRPHPGPVRRHRGAQLAVRGAPVRRPASRTSRRPEPVLRASFRTCGLSPAHFIVNMTLKGGGREPRKHPRTPAATAVHPSGHSGQLDGSPRIRQRSALRLARRPPAPGQLANWPLGIANNLFFIVLFTQAGLYADAGLQIVFIALAVYGWWTWTHGGGPGSDALPVRRTSRTEWTWLITAGVVGTLVLTLLLDRATDSTVPFWDALTTALSLTATYGQCRKRLESWWLWIAADVIYVPLYAYKELYLTSLLYIGFMTLCVLGLRRWTRDLADRTALHEEAVA